MNFDCEAMIVKDDEEEGRRGKSELRIFRKFGSLATTTELNRMSNWDDEIDRGSILIGFYWFDWGIKAAFYGFISMVMKIHRMD